MRITDYIRLILLAAIWGHLPRHHLARENDLSTKKPHDSLTS